MSNISVRSPMTSFWHSRQRSNSTSINASMSGLSSGIEVTWRAVNLSAIDSNPLFGSSLNEIQSSSLSVSWSFWSSWANSSLLE
jgi:hypothetical protein